MAEAKFEAAIFDVDELMIRSERNRSFAFETMIRNRGGTPAPNEYGVVQTIGINVRDNCQHMKLQYGLDGEPDELAAEHESAYTELLAGGVEAMPGFYTLVALLGRKGIKLAIASSGSLEHIDMAVHGERGLFPSPLPSPFQAVASGKEVKKGKPAPDIYLLAAKRLNVPIANCVVLEDAPNGIIGADTAGAKTVAIPSEFTQGEDFSRATEKVASLEHVTWEFLSGLYLPKTL